MNTFRIVGKGLIAGSLVGLAAVELGFFLAGIYGAIYAFFLCPLIAIPAATCAMLWAAGSTSSAKE